MNSRSAGSIALILAATLASCDDASEAPTDAALDTEEDGVDAVDEDGTADDADAEPSDDADDAADDTPAEDPDAGSTDGSGEPDADADATPMAFERTYTDAAAHPAPAGMRWARGIVHLHSTHSHDACDDVPRMPDGSFNEDCLQSLRNALCEVRVDVAYLTDHPTHMDEEGFADLLLHKPETDTLIGEDGAPYANRMPCPSGHEVLIRVGAEDALMPLGMRRHVSADTFEARHEIMNAYTAEAAAAMRDAGGSVWVAHTEEKDAADLRRIGIDGMEVYQLHANLDPRIREESLGLDPIGPIGQLLPVMAGASTLPPDLALLGFLDPNRPSLATWAELLQEGPVVGTAGTDAHENTFPGEMIDGERLDSYRRMMSWFSNYLLVEGELTPESADDALRSGRVLIAFDTIASPAGVDFYVDTGAGRIEMGASADWSEGARLRGTVPAPVGQSGIPVELSGAVLRADGNAWVEVAAVAPGTLDIALDSAGVYRVELRATAAHFAPWLAEFAAWGEQTYPWVYSNAWRLEAAPE